MNNSLDFKKFDYNFVESYARGKDDKSTKKPLLSEDQRFLKLAQEALVATASNISSSIVDPTITDLLTRLQYASSPHGNPIKKSDSLSINNSGQLNIQEFYNLFPNLSNDIYKDKDGVEWNENEKFETRRNDEYLEKVDGYQNGEKYLEKDGYQNGEKYLGKDGYQGKYRDSVDGKYLGNQQIGDRGFSGDRGYSDKGYPSILNSHPDNHPNAHSQIQQHPSQSWNFILSPKDSEPGQIKNSGLNPNLSEDSDTNEKFHPDRHFKCLSCIQTFKRSSDLKRHEKQHLTIPPSICSHCGKGFARKDALKRHKNTLTCKRNFEKKLYLKNLQFLEKLD